MKRASVLFLVAIVALYVDLARAQDSSAPMTKTAVLAGGCFWCIQPAFDKAPGVI
jgi:peptide-methionine (S)-S-oxide reductase